MRCNTESQTPQIEFDFPWLDLAPYCLAGMQMLAASHHNYLILPNLTKESLISDHLLLNII